MFQNLMDQVLGDLPFCFVYVDYILIFSQDLSGQPLRGLPPLLEAWVDDRATQRRICGF